MRKLSREALSRVLISIVACFHVEAFAQGAASPSFSRQIQPILDANCVACHQAGAAQQGLVLESAAAYANVGKRSAEAAMNLIEPGSPDSSYLFQKVNGTHLRANGQGARMPLGGALEAADIEAIRLWILAGAKND